MALLTELPPLREDLNLYQGPALRDGSPTWTIHDPLRNLYFRIGWQEFEIISNFHLRSLASMLHKLQKIGMIDNVEGRISDLVEFLKRNELVESDHSENVRKSNLGVQSLLFIKIPLFHPDRVLSSIYPVLSILFHPFVIAGWVIAGIFSLLMVVQQWDNFFATFTAFNNPAGVAAFIVAILFGKIVHEMGHALTAKHFGIQVPIFGVALMFFWPLFYTDGSDGWKLKSGRSRLLISGAGVMAESMLAIVATLAWLWLPDGMPRSIAFTVAATTWIMTLMINLNPFMRFDGYFILSDLWEIPNLQQRAFHLGREKLRALLLGADSIEPLSGESRAQSSRLIVYAWLTWIYRLTLYIGIAFLAFTYLFKLLGIILFITEMSLLVAKPIIYELRQIWSLRAEFKWVGSNKIILSLVIVAISLIITPWKSSVDAPAIWRGGELHRIYSVERGKLIDLMVKLDSEIKSGDRIVLLDTPELEYEQSRLLEQIAEQQSRVQSGRVDARLRKESRVEQQKLKRLNSRLKVVAERISLADISSPISGRVIDINSYISESEWVSKGEYILSLANQKKSVVAWFHERDLAGLKIGAKGRFIPEYTTSSTSMKSSTVLVRVDKIALNGSILLDEPLLSSLNGGDLSVRMGSNGEHKLQESYYRVELTIDPDSKQSVQFPVGELRGSVSVDADSSTYISRWWGTISSLLISESGF